VSGDEVIEKMAKVLSDPEKLIGHIVELSAVLTDEQMRELILKLQKVLCNR
jgi:hypothetical protein